MTAPRFHLQLLYHPEVREVASDSILLSAGKPLALLAYLTLTREPVLRDDLVSLLWPEADRSRGKASLRQALWTLRGTLGEKVFASNDPVGLEDHWADVDLFIFREALANGDLEKANACWKGPPLNGLEFPRAKPWRSWVDELQQQEEARFGDALAGSAQSLMASGNPEETERWLRRAIEIQPYRLSHRVSLVDLLLETNSLHEAEAALSSARNWFEDIESRSSLDPLRERLEILKTKRSRAGSRQGLRTEFVGRTSEFSTLASNWRRVSSGESKVAVVSGTPGVGKTRLAEEFAFWVRSEGGLSVSVKSAEAERSLEWGISAELVRSLYGMPGAAGISNRSAEVLAGLVPSLSIHTGSPSDPTPPGSVQDAAVIDAILDLVSAVAEEGPTLLLFDDLQWVDKQSRAAFSHMARALEREQVFLLFTCRTGGRDPEVERVLGSLFRNPNATEIPLGPLRLTEVSELLALLLESLQPQDLETLATKVYSITQGNPLFIVEVLQLLHSEGLLHRNKDDGWQIKPDTIQEELPVPKTIESAIERRLEDLDEPGRTLAVQLASQARPVHGEDLHRLTGLDPFEVSEGIRQLFQIDLIHRVSGERIDFIHDSVRAVAGARLKVQAAHGKEAPPSRSPRRRALTMISALAVSLAAVLVVWFSLGGLGRVPFLGSFSADGLRDYPYGHGRLYVRTGAGAYWVTPPPREGGVWVTEDADLPFPHPFLYGPFLNPDGTTSWFARGREGPEYPPFPGIPRQNEGVDPIWQIEGDAGFHDLSPDGETALLWEENLDAPQYARTLLTLNLETGRTHTVFEGEDQMGNADWSPDGHLIAFTQNLTGDRILVSTPLGLITDSVEVVEASSVRRPGWCSDSDHLAFLSRNEGQSHPSLIEVSSGELRHLPTPVADDAQLVCLGEAGAIVFQGSEGPEPQLFVQDLRTDSLYSLPELSGKKVLGLAWVPNQPEPVSVGVRILEGEVELAVGDTVRLTAEAEASDGSVRPVLVDWMSHAPSVASVSPEGTVTANSAGEARVSARFANWLETSVTVEVKDPDGPATWIVEDFPSDSLPQWESFEYPPPRVLPLDGLNALSLEGDGRYSEGLRSRRTFPIRTGITAEIEFRLRLTHLEHQNIEFWLERVDHLDENAVGIWAGNSTGEGIGFRYPGHLEGRPDPLTIRVRNDLTAREELVLLPPNFDSSRWASFSLRIRPDGVVSLGANGVPLELDGYLIRVPPDSEWRLRLAGASVDTDLFVRKVTARSGVR